MASRPQPDLVVCTGKACRRSRGHDEVLRLAAGRAHTAVVACQGLCDGPVVALRRRGRLRWYERVRGGRHRALLRVLGTGKGWKALRPAEVRRRRGELRRPGTLRPLN